MFQTSVGRPPPDRTAAIGLGAWFAIAAMLALSVLGYFAPQTPRRTDVACSSAATRQFYFPAGTFHASGEHDTGTVTRASRALSGLHKPSLSCGAPGESYRFTWLGSFHAPVVVRVDVRDGVARLVAQEWLDPQRRLDTRSGRRTVRTLSPQAWRRLGAALDGIWSLQQAPSGQGLDGAEWIVEARSGTRHHAISQWSPGAGTLHDVGRQLIDLTGWAAPEREIY